MVLVLVVLTVAVGLGLAAGGTMNRLGEMRLVRPSLVPLGLAAQLAGVVIGGPAYPLGLLVSAGCVAAFLVLNRGLRGTGLVALGLLANALVVGANGAMPVSVDASGRAGISTQYLVAGADPRHELSGPDTRLPWLADVIPVRLPWRPEVVSVGDVLLAAGIAQLVVLGLHGRQPLAPGARVPSSGMARAVRPHPGPSRQ